ncbi:UNVERIFIED_CONTAM: hypothetical protein PYX00_000879 [Menopon gallinae]|uniref:Uncharacterized protein n=1 Tax=Menopon gallinae TaxID=328185 RepID=A0AAW2IAS6_9NEOP
MPKLWTCKEDAIRDLVQLNKFGDVDENELRAAFTDQPVDSDPEAAEFVDVRSGEVIEDLRESTKFPSYGRGRGRVLEDYKHRKELQRQLRMIRPMGLGNEMIVSCIKSENDKKEGREEPENSSDSVDSSEGAAAAEKREVPEKHNRQSKNVLMSSLLGKIKSTTSQDGGELEPEELEPWVASEEVNRVRDFSSVLSLANRSSYNRPKDDNFDFNPEQYPQL